MSSVVDWIHEKRKRERERENLYFYSSDGDGTCWDDEKTSRQWLWWIRAQQADAGILPFVVSAWMRLFFSAISHLFWLPDYLCLYQSLEDNQYFNCLFSAGYGTKREREKTGVGQTQNDVHHSVLDRLHHKSEMYTSFHSPEHVKHADVSKSKSRNSNLYDTSIRIENSSMTEARHARTREKTVVWNQMTREFSSMTQFFLFEQ